MRIFLTGANGFIGGSVAHALMADGHTVRGLVRDEEKAKIVRALGIDPVVGSLDDAELLIAESRAADAVINTANSDHRGAIEAIVKGLEGSNKVFIHTSGSSIVGDEAMGEPSDKVYYEESKLVPEPDKVARVAIDQYVLNAPGIRGIVLCNTMIYGHAVGAPAQSVQVPRLVKQAKDAGVARFIGRGLNRWSNTHIADVGDAYALALKKAPAGSFLYVESGEEALGEIVRAIGEKLGMKSESMTAEEAVKIWGREYAVFALGSNSRVRGKLATEVLGWQPKRRSITEWIKEEL